MTEVDFSFGSMAGMVLTPAAKFLQEKVATPGKTGVVLRIHDFDGELTTDLGNIGDIKTMVTLVEEVLTGWRRDKEIQEKTPHENGDITLVNPNQVNVDVHTGHGSHREIVYFQFIGVDGPELVGALRADPTIRFYVKLSRPGKP